MNKKGKNIELKIYELLGIKIFRKMAFGLRDISALALKMSKEERTDKPYNTASTYNIGKIDSLEDIKKFKKNLFINAGIHLWALSLCLIGGTASLPIPITIINLIGIGINLYCIMLQRYNCVRINQLIKKMTPRYEKQKESIKEELRKDDLLFKDHTYKIVDKKERETSITLEDLIATATIEQLKQYRDHLSYFKEKKQMMEEQPSYYTSDEQPSISVPLQKNKTLKLELKLRKQDENSN